MVRLGAPAAAKISISRSADMRYAGQGHEILVELPDGPFTAALGRRAAQALRGGLPRAVQPRRARRRCRGHRLDPARRGAGARPRRATSCRGLGRLTSEPPSPRPIGTRTLFDPMLRDFTTVPVYHRATLEAGQPLQGPAIIAEDETTTIVTSGFVAALDPSGAIRLTAKSAVLQEAAQ